MASIREVARLAGVSTATVSNVLNGRFERVGDETKDKVLAAVRHLKYRPTPLEQKQKAILIQNIGVMVPDLTGSPISSNGYFRDVLDGVLEVSALNGWSMTVFVQRMWDDVGHAVRRSYDGRCDGLIMVSPERGNEVVQTLHDRGTPLVLVGSTPWLRNVSSVDVDNHAIGVAAAQHLVEFGHRRLSYVGYAHEHISSVERRAGFLEEGARLGLREDEVGWLCLQTQHPHRVDAELLSPWIQRQDRSTGLFCWHDGLASKIIPVLAAENLHAPRDYSILAVDNSPESRASSPRITSFTNPFDELGKRAAKLIIDRLADGLDQTEIVKMSSELVVQGSTGPAPKPAF